MVGLPSYNKVSYLGGVHDVSLGLYKVFVYEDKDKEVAHNEDGLKLLITENSGFKYTIFKASELLIL